jgi:hypothetical protein
MSFVKLDNGHRPVSTEVFLDTSVHCCFHKGETLGPRLNWLLGLFSWKGSSTYSQTEYGRGCKLLADAIIAVDGKDYRNFVTQNYKESQVLTKVFAQRCYYLPNNPEHGVGILEHDDQDPA